VILHPSWADAHELLARYLRESGDHAALRAESCRWAELNPDDPGRWREAAAAALTPPDAPDAALAVRAARRAVALAPDDGLLQVVLSDACAAAGDVEGAAAAAAAALTRLGDAAPDAVRGRLAPRVRPR
jgi:hypothetical protein